MRIILTNAGKKEIIIDEEEKLSQNKFHSEEKIKYSPQIIIPSTKRESLKYIKNNIINSEKRLLTEAPLLSQSKSLRKSLTINNPNLLEFKSDKKNSYKNINIRQSKRLASKKLDNMFSIEEKNENKYNYDRKKNKFQIKQLKDGFYLPLIKNTLPLKDILIDKNAKNINNKILKTKLNTNENHLINYLKLDKTIKPSFIEKLKNADNDRLVKLDKICQKYFTDQKRNDLMQQNIQDKIKLEYSKDSKYCKENLINMQKDIQNYKKIYKSYINLYHLKYNK